MAFGSHDFNVVQWLKTLVTLRALRDGVATMLTGGRARRWREQSWEGKGWMPAGCLYFCFFVLVWVPQITAPCVCIRVSACRERQLRASEARL